MYLKMLLRVFFTIFQKREDPLLLFIDKAADFVLNLEFSNSFESYMHFITSLVLIFS